MRISRSPPFIDIPKHTSPLCIRVLRIRRFTAGITLSLLNNHPMNISYNRSTKTSLLPSQTFSQQKAPKPFAPRSTRARKITSRSQKSNPKPDERKKKEKRHRVCLHSPLPRGACCCTGGREKLSKRADIKINPAAARLWAPRARTSRRAAGLARLYYLHSRRGDFPRRRLFFRFWISRARVTAAFSSAVLFFLAFFPGGGVNDGAWIVLGGYSKVGNASERLIGVDDEESW